MHIHLKLKKLRHAKNLSQQTVADILCISQNAYSLIESGKTKIDEQRIIQLAKIFKVQPAVLLTEDTQNADITKEVTPATSHNDLVALLTTQLSKKDEQIDKLLQQIHMYSQLIELPKG